MAADKRSSPPWTTWISPEGIGVLVAAGATAALASMPIVLVPGALAYGLVTLLRYNRWKAASHAVDLDDEQPELNGLMDPYAATVRRCAVVQSKVLAEIRTAERTHRALLEASAERIKGLVQAAAQLARKLQRIDAGLTTAYSLELQRQQTVLERKIAEATDDKARRGYERALEQHRQKVAAMDDLRARRQQIDAELTNIELTFETVLAQVIGMKSAEITDATRQGARVVESLDQLSIAVSAAAETIEEAELYAYESEAEATEVTRERER